jgi:hypothetical protein
MNVVNEMIQRIVKQRNEWLEIYPFLSQKRQEETASTIKVTLNDRIVMFRDAGVYTIGNDKVYRYGVSPEDYEALNKEWHRLYKYQKPAKPEEKVSE